MFLFRPPKSCGLIFDKKMASKFFGGLNQKSESITFSGIWSSNSYTFRGAVLGVLHFTVLTFYTFRGASIRGFTLYSTNLLHFKGGGGGGMGVLHFTVLTFYTFRGGRYGGFTLYSTNLLHFLGACIGGFTLYSTNLLHF